MSDRIDELGSLARSLAHRLHLRLTEAAGAGYMMPDAQVMALTDAITELATIAREAEARALEAEAEVEWLVDITASHAVAANLLREDETRDEYKARLLKAASEAV